MMMMKIGSSANINRHWRLIAGIVLSRSLTRSGKGRTKALLWENKRLHPIITLSARDVHATVLDIFKVFFLHTDSATLYILLSYLMGISRDC